MRGVITDVFLLCLLYYFWVIWAAKEFDRQCSPPVSTDVEQIINDAKFQFGNCTETANIPSLDGSAYCTEGLYSIYSIAIGIIQSAFG